MRRLISTAVAAAVVLSGLVAAPAGAHTYAGKTAKGGRIGFRLSPAETYFVNLSAKRELSCRKGRIRSFRFGIFRQVSVFVRVSRAGAFGGSVAVRGPRRSLVRSGRFNISGRVGERRAKGVFRERSRLRDGTRCDSGSVRFSIRLVSRNE